MFRKKKNVLFDGDKSMPFGKRALTSKEKQQLLEKEARMSELHTAKEELCASLRQFKINDLRDILVLLVLLFCIFFVPFFLSRY